MNSIRVALVEDDEFVRTTTAAYLGRQPELNCVVVADSTEALLTELELSLPPQVVILDVNLPGLSGLEAIPLILRRLPEVCILMQTVLDDTDTIYQALCRGAMGYITKGHTLTELKEAVLEVMCGGTPFSRSISRKVLAHFRPTPRTQPALLSAREQQVLEALIDGLTVKQTAARLGVGTESVRTYIKNVYHKLQVRSRPELLNRVIRGDL